MKSLVWIALRGRVIPEIVIATKGWFTVEVKGETVTVRKAEFEEGLADAILPPIVTDTLKLAEINVNSDGNPIVILSPLIANLGSLVYIKIVQVFVATAFIWTLVYLKVEFFNPPICTFIALSKIVFEIS